MTCFGSVGPSLYRSPFPTASRRFGCFESLADLLILGNHVCDGIAYLWSFCASLGSRPWPISGRHPIQHHRTPRFCTQRKRVFTIVHFGILDSLYKSSVWDGPLVSFSWALLLHFLVSPNFSLLRRLVCCAPNDVVVVADSWEHSESKEKELPVETCESTYPRMTEKPIVYVQDSRNTIV